MDGNLISERYDPETYKRKLLELFNGKSIKSGKSKVGKQKRSSEENDKSQSVSKKPEINDDSLMDTTDDDVAHNMKNSTAKSFKSANSKGISNRRFLNRLNKAPKRTNKIEKNKIKRRKVANNFIVEPDDNLCNSPINNQENCISRIVSLGCSLSGSNKGKIPMDNIDAIGFLLSSYSDIQCVADNDIVNGDTMDEAGYANNSSKTEDVQEEYSEDELPDSTLHEPLVNNIQFSLTENIDYLYSNNLLIILLHNTVKLYFHGCAKVRVLIGAVDLLGYTLTASSSSFDVFSPRGTSFLYFEWKYNPDASILEHIPKQLENLGISNEEFLQKIQPTTAVILCEQVNESKINFMEKHIAQQIFPKCDGPDFCFFENAGSSAGNVLKINENWEKLAGKINPTSRIFICGGKSVGKSVFLRYCINKLLMRFPKILVIDLDPGQPEFTIPGCISANIIVEPVFGPNYTHLRKPHKCLFVPHINIGYEPNEYLDTVKHLMQQLTVNEDELPTLINYMGFTRAIGPALLCAVIAYTQPTNIVEIRSNSKNRNYQQPITYKSILKQSKQLAPDVHHIQRFWVDVVESMADENQGWHLQPRQIRELCVLSYLGNMLPEGALSLTDKQVPLYEVSLSSVKLIYQNQIVSPAVANANLVALCSEVSPGLYNCYGWGVIRTIDMGAQMLFLLTPLVEKDLEEVNCLIVGSVTLPPSLYMTTDDNTVGLIPYVASYVQTFSQGQIPKRSHYLQRKVSSPIE